MNIAICVVFVPVLEFGGSSTNPELVLIVILCVFVNMIIISIRLDEHVCFPAILVGVRSRSALEISLGHTYRLCR